MLGWYTATRRGGLWGFVSYYQPYLANNSLLLTQSLLVYNECDHVEVERSDLLKQIRSESETNNLYPINS